MDIETNPTSDPNPNPNPVPSPNPVPDPNPAPPLTEEPNPKKQKMSTTTTSDDEEQNDQTTLAASAVGDAPPRKPRYKRRKIAIFFAYCGVGYQGMQKNPGAKTIEGDLEEALYQAGSIPEPDRGMLQRVDWARSARTDKGVSAVGQVVSGKFYVDPPGFVERLRSNLPAQIRIFGYKRVVPSFNAKKYCDRRRYVYLIPVFALDPTCHRDRESVMASLGSGNELVKCVECSERGRKVFGVMGRRGFESKSGSGILSHSLGACSGVESEGKNDGNSSENANDGADKQFSSLENADKSSNGIGRTEKVDDDSENVNESKAGSGISSNRVGSLSNSKCEDKNDTISIENGNDGADKQLLSSETAEKLDNGTGRTEKTRGVENCEVKVEFKYGEKEIERFNRILKYYEGTHNFHNFTTRTKAEDPAAKRYIISFNANTVVNVGGIAFVKCEVVGQSFMLHQIRKMIGLAVAIMRNIAPESLMEIAFEQKVKINVPMAPEVGLYLDECFFSSYNKKWKGTHEELSMKDYAEEAEAFKMEYIYSHIASAEHKDGPVALWLHSLNYRNYPDLRGADHFQNDDVKRNDEVKRDEAVESCPSTDVKVDDVVKNDSNTDLKGDDEVVDQCANTGEKSVEAVENYTNAEVKGDEMVDMAE